MTYREHAPCSTLAPWLACSWERTETGEAPARILPDGCIDIVWIEGLGTRVVGANTTAFLVALPPGTRALGARFEPGAAPALLGLAAEALRDTHAPIDEVLGARGARLGAALEADGDGVAVLRRELAVIALRAERPDPLVRAAVVRLGRPGGRIAAIADELGVSERQLRRRVSRVVGYGPKRLARVLRLQGALAAARCGGELGRVAFEAGFADQSHLTNECRELAGVPPGELLGRSSHASGSCKTTRL